MTSQLNVDTIVDKAGSGGTNITVANNATYVAEGGSTNSHNVVQGLVKAWDHVSGDGTTIDDSFNISSHTDSATGQGFHVFTNNMNNNDWSRMGFNQWSDFATGNGAYAISTGNPTSTSQMRLLHYENASATDPQQRYILVAGDLA